MSALQRVITRSNAADSPNVVAGSGMTQLEQLQLRTCRVLEVLDVQFSGSGSRRDSPPCDFSIDLISTTRLVQINLSQSTRTALDDLVAVAELLLCVRWH